MDDLKEVFSLLDTAMADGKQSFTVETGLSGAVLVWNVPTGSIASITKLTNDEVIAERVKAIGILSQKKITVDDHVYNLEFQTSNGDNQRVGNIRFLMSYNGPKLDKAIHGIMVKKEVLNAWLIRTVKRVVYKVKLETEKNAKPGRKQTVDASYQARFVKLVGRYTDAQMTFCIIPNKPQYAPIAIDNMPAKIRGIVVTRVPTVDNRRPVYSMMAAGEPYLKAIGDSLDRSMKPIIDQM
ncbi:hypothetical protein [Rhizobium phage RHEph12]|nr:hypothetical protein [Rhizobium phage RHEph12]